MPPQDGDLYFRRVVLPLLVLSFTLLGERPLHFHLNRNSDVVAKLGMASPDGSLLTSTLATAATLLVFGNDPDGPFSVMRKTPVLT